MSHAPEPGPVITLDFQGFNQPLGIRLGDQSLSLAPWTYRRHMDALRHCVATSPAGLRLHGERLCDQVLDSLALDAAARRQLAPLALWWAAGGDADLPPPPAPGEWLALGEGSGRARLAPWSEGQRLRALHGALSAPPDDGDESWFDPVLYLDAMVRASLQHLDAPTDLDALDSRATAVVLHASVALNVVDEDDATLLGGGPAAQQIAARSLRLCQALGWTPSKVWATPAAEVDRLLRMLDLVQPARPQPGAAPRRRPSLAEHPDATVIRIEDDAA